MAHVWYRICSKCNPEKGLLFVSRHTRDEQRFFGKWSVYTIIMCKDLERSQSDWLLDQTQYIMVFTTARDHRNTVYNCVDTLKQSIKQSRETFFVIDFVPRIFCFFRKRKKYTIYYSARYGVFLRWFCCHFPLFYRRNIAYICLASKAVNNSTCLTLSSASSALDSASTTRCSSSLNCKQ